MAKLRGAKKAAFLRRMAKGRAKSRRASGRPVRRVRRKRRRNGLNSYNPSRKRRVRRVRFRRNPTAVIANPGYSRAYAAGWEGIFGSKKTRKRKRKGTSTMAKRRRRKARRASPKRRVHRRRRSPVRRRRGHARRRSGRRGKVSFARRVPRGTRVIYINGRRRRRGSRSRRRNPGMGGLIRRTFVPYAVGFITSGLAAVLDTGLANYPMAKRLAKVVGCLVIAKMVRNQITATAAIASLAASEGYTLGTRLAGGMVAHSPAQAVGGLGEMAGSYPELGALLNGGIGALLNGVPDVDTAVVNYATALNNMADDDS
jgi:hypothetical protein